VCSAALSISPSVGSCGKCRQQINVFQPLANESEIPTHSQLSPASCPERMSPPHTPWRASSVFRSKTCAMTPEAEGSSPVHPQPSVACAAPRRGLRFPLRSVATYNAHAPLAEELDTMRSSPRATAHLPWPLRAATRRLTHRILVLCIRIIDFRQRARLLVAIGGCLAVLTTPPTSAAAQQQFDSWTTENGLPQNSVNDILQTRDGYLWLATFGGLVRFDGVRFVVFDRSTKGVESQRVNALLEDRHGTLWAATEDGMMICYRDGRFTTYTRKDGLPHDGAVRIDEDDEGNLWITWLGSVTKYDGRRFLNLGSDHFPNRVVAPPQTRFLDAWWSQDSTGLHVLTKGRVKTYSVRSDLQGADVTGVNHDKRDNLWIRSRVGVIKASHGRLERYTTREGLPNNHPGGRFYEGREADTWLADDPANLYRIRNGKPELIKLPGAPLSILRSFYVDREGSTWLGSTATGLHRVREPTVTVYTERDGRSLKNM
jgi:hypothetical protein